MLIFYLNAVNNDKEISGPTRKGKEDFVDFLKLIKMKKWDTYLLNYVSAVI